MTGQVYIDGYDIYTNFGVVLADGALKGLMEFPALKEPEKSDWAERDGIDVDLTAPVLSSKEFDVPFYGKELIDNFIEFLMSESTHLFSFSVIGIAKTLRIISFSDYKQFGIKGLTVRVADDNPLSGYTYSAPSSSLVSQTGYKLDSLFLSQYGVLVSAGSNDEILKPFPVKTNLIIESKYKKGLTYNDDVIKYKEKEVRLNLLMIANSTSNLLQNYNALLYNLSKKDARIFDCDGNLFECYYKSMNVQEFAYSPRLWLRFSLNMVFTKRV